ncbi:dienelactone hydrolase family protein [Sinimarinibacterium sp. CAU 1509]|nr:dienelactone hydrolase family protein [Sinimarinibacterium sp. CAU 1509]
MLTSMMGHAGSASQTGAQIVEKIVDYRMGDREHRAYVYYDDSIRSSRPLLLMVPNWLGTTAANRSQAAQIAGRDYVVFVADMYGRDAQPADAAAAGRTVQALYGDRADLRRRILAAHEQALAWAAQAADIADVQRFAAIGFCFGGATVLELARTGTPLSAVVSFHGNLSLPPSEVPDQPLRTRILALHGDADPYVPQPQVDAFVEEMRSAGADWQLVRFGGAVHSFTDPDANTPGKAQYNPKAAHRAYAMMRNFLADAFAGR